MILATRGLTRDSAIALWRSQRIMQTQREIQGNGVALALLAQRALWVGNPARARSPADRAWELAHLMRIEGDFIRAARLQGTAALRVAIGG
jgi:hypothetical protein